jgi:hypothetical protein
VAGIHVKDRQLTEMFGGSSLSMMHQHKPDDDQGQAIRHKPSSPPRLAYRSDGTTTTATTARADLPLSREV